MVIFPNRRRDGTTPPGTQQGEPSSTGELPRKSCSSISLSQDRIHRRPAVNTPISISLGQEGTGFENRTTVPAETRVADGLNVPVANGLDSLSDCMLDRSSSNGSASETQVTSTEHEASFGSSREHVPAMTSITPATDTSMRSNRGSVAPHIQLEPSTVGDIHMADYLSAAHSQADYQSDQTRPQNDHRRLRYDRWFRERLFGPWMPGNGRNRRAIRKAIRDIQKHLP